MNCDIETGLEVKLASSPQAGIGFKEPSGVSYLFINQQFSHGNVKESIV